MQSLKTITGIKFTDQFVTMQRKSATDDILRKPVTDDSIKVDTSRKPVMTTHEPTGPDWLNVGSIILKDKENSILFLPNAYLNDRIMNATQEMLKWQYPHIWSLDTCPKARGNFIQILKIETTKG